ncbi:hypothetical protein HED60_14030 [Planctomycetales bacterium ZRK34]|nr:hypothetical protein HED60_14030 [Planctomycetales bacterium ZRK34]
MTYNGKDGMNVGGLRIIVEMPDSRLYKGFKAKCACDDADMKEINHRRRFDSARIVR